MQKIGKITSRNTISSTDLKYNVAVLAERLPTRQGNKKMQPEIVKKLKKISTNTRQTW